MAIDARVLDKATIALTSPADYKWEARISEIREGSIALDRTNFFPNLTAQPCDQGHIVRVDDGRTWRVTNAEFDGTKVWHDLEDHEGLAVGDAVIAHVNNQRRYFLSRSHSAAVLVSGLAYRRWNSCIVTSCSLSLTRIRMDFSGGTRLRSEVEQLLLRANEFINADGEVSTFMLPTRLALRNPEYVRSHVLLDELSKMGAMARVVRITSHDQVLEEQFDLGTHVRALREIGPLALGTSDHRAPTRRKGTHHFRIRFHLAEPSPDATLDMIKTPDI